MQENKVVLVTGSSRGIGAGLVKNLAKKGCQVVINYAKSDEEARQLYDEISNHVGHGVVLMVKADVSRREEVSAMFDAVSAEFGQVDVLINNAGLNIDGPFLEMTDEQWRRVIATNLTGTFICSQEFALRLTGDLGHIINIGASTGIRGRKNGANYCSAKAGVITLTKCLALELAPSIRVNCIIPGFIETEEVMTRYNLYDKTNYDKEVNATPLKRLGTPEDVFKVVHFLINDADYITGQNFFVNGGNFMY
jgi:3-oxoacyl-[acyl-carrier protein] reductase